MLKNLTEVIQQTNNFEDLISEMKLRGFIIQLSKNEKVGISGMRIILEKDINHQTERQYKPGYKLSEVSKTLKIAEIKNIFEIKNAFLVESKVASNWKELWENLYRKGWNVKIQYKGEFKENGKNKVQDFTIIGVGSNKSSQQKDGFFFKKGQGFSLSAIDSEFGNLTKDIALGTEMKSNEVNSNFSTQSTLETLKEVSEELIEDFLKPNYVAQQDDEWWKRKKKGRR